jgi:hypothetical protein
MSYDIHQVFGLGIKVRDIARSEAEPNDFVFVEFPYQKTQHGDIDMDTFRKYDLLKFSDEPPPVDDSCLLLHRNPALESLLIRHAHSKADPGEFYGPESVMECLIESLLTVEIDSFAYPHFVSVCSTRFGNCHELGGMVDDEPYLLYGEFENLGDDGKWTDPREDPERNEVISSISRLLVGPNHSGFTLLKPIFGG